MKGIFRIKILFVYLDLVFFILIKNSAIGQPLFSLALANGTTVLNIPPAL